MKKYIAYGVLIVWVIAVVQLLVRFEDEDESIITAFESDNYLESTSTLDSFFYYGDVYLSKNDREGLLNAIVGRLGISNKYKYTDKKTKQGCISTLEYGYRGGKLIVELNTVEKQIDSKVSTLSHYLTVKMTFDNSPETAWYYRDELRKILGELPYIEKIPEVTLSLEGKIRGKVDDESRMIMTENLFNQLGAREVFGREESENNSIYGYTDGIDEFKKIGSEKVNVNIAFAYDETNNITTLYLATPVITIDY